MWVDGSELRWSKHSAATPRVARTGGGERRKIVGKEITKSGTIERIGHFRHVRDR